MAGQNTERLVVLRDMMDPRAKALEIRCRGRREVTPAEVGYATDYEDLRSIPIHAGKVRRKVGSVPISLSSRGHLARRSTPGGLVWTTRRYKP